MADFRLCAFADEASPKLDEQILALQRNEIKLLEIRGVDGQTVTDLSDDELVLVKEKLDAAGIKVWSIGSPLGKTSFQEQEEHQRRFERALAAAKIFGAKQIRMFSFFIGTDEEAVAFEADIFNELGRISKLAEAEGVTLCHENESGIYGSTAERTLKLLKQVPTLGGIFDPANYVQCGEKPAEIFSEFKPYTHYLHIKDALAEDGTIVPAGKGDGGIAEVLAAFYEKDAGRVLTLEPHLANFVGLGSLQHEGLKHKYSYDTPGDAFDAAVAALRGVLDEAGYSYE